MVDGCIEDGAQLYWSAKCLTYGVSELNTSVLNIDGAEFDAIVGEAFDVWRGVDCGDGKHPGFEVQSVGVVDSNGKFTCRRELRANLSVWSLVTRWTRPGAIAVTATGFDTNTGEIFDSDVDFHLAKLLSDVAPEDYALVLRKVAVHEAGHYLGLAHSQVPDAAMEEDYGAVELVSHDLTLDDIEGICALYPPDEATECSKPGYVEAALGPEACEEAARSSGPSQQDDGGCAVQGRPRSPWPWYVVGMSALVALGARRWAEPRRGSAR